MVRCPFCGSYILETDTRKICPNCGVIEDNSESKEKEPDYIG